MRTYPTKNYVTPRDVTRNYCATLLFICCFQFAFSQTNYLKLPAGSPKVINGQSNLIIENLSFTNLSGNIIQIFSSSNITIRNCYFGASLGEAISIEGSSNITIENCFFANNRTGVYAVSSSGIKVNNNQFINVHGPFPRGQYVQFNRVTGAGNSIIGNKGECFKGESYPEDLVNMFNSSGTSASPINISNNQLRGGGPSFSGGGILGGDYGGNWIRVENNLLVDPGNYGVAVSGGNNITLNANKVYSRWHSYNNAGLIVWAQGGATCFNINVTRNEINFPYKYGGQNNLFDGGGCGSVDYSSNIWNQSLQSMNFPEKLITSVTEDELWQIREQSQQFRLTATVGINPPWLLRPTANAGEDKSVNESTTTLTGSGGSSYRWVQVSGPNNAILANANSDKLSLSGLVDGVYTFRLEASNIEGAADADWVVITVANNQPEPNQPPVANAGSNIVLTLPANAATLTGSGSDADGTIASYAWSRVSGPATFTLVSGNAATTTLKDLVEGTYVFGLTATDNDGATDTDEITVIVNTAQIINQPPVANAGNNIVLTLPANATTLTGTGTDADGAIASYAWSKVSGPATFTLVSGNAATTTLKDLVEGTYVFGLTATDNDGVTDTDEIMVTVNAAQIINQPPVANAGNNMVLTLPANAATLTGTGTDADGTIASYAWSKVSGPSTFTLASGNAATTTLKDLVEGTYVFRLTVRDNSGATDTDDKTVTVKAAAVINQPPVANAGNNMVLTLPANAATLTGTGTDADGTIASYAWSKVSGPSTFTLVSGNAATTTLKDLVEGTYVFRLTVKDNSGATDIDDKTVTVKAAAVINQPPVANAGVFQIATLSSNEVTLNGTLSRDPDGVIKTYKWEQIAGPANAVIVSSSSVITKVSSFIEGDYVFQLTVKDNRNAIAKDTVTIAIVNNFRSYPGEFMLYPNPASGEINLKLYNERYSKAQVTLYDVTGRKVLPAIELDNSQNRFIKTMDISQLKAGMYLVEVIMDNKEKVTAKFVKQ